MKKLALLVLLLAGTASAQFRQRGPNAAFSGTTPSVRLSGSAPQMECTSVSATCQFLSRTNDATTSAAVAAFTLKLAADITDADLAFALQNSAGTNVFTISETGVLNAPAMNFTVNSNGVYAGAFRAVGSSSAALIGGPADGPTAVGVILQSAATYADSSAKLVSIRNNGAEEFYVDSSGGFSATGDSGIAGNLYMATPARIFASSSGVPLSIHGPAGTTTFFSVATPADADVFQISSTGGVRLNIQSGAKPTCEAAIRGTIHYSPGGAGVADALEVCRKDAADAYAWVALY